ncbi:MAG: sensor histidine kinase [bacterium]
MSKIADSLEKKEDCKCESAIERNCKLFFDYQLSEDPIKKDEEIDPLCLSSIFLDPSACKYIERKFVEISERERRRIGQDLHDGLGQILTGISFISKVLERKLAVKLVEEADQVAIITKLVNEAICSMSSLVRTLNPVRLEEDGFIVALQELAKNIKKTFGISCRINFDRPVFINENLMATHLYRIVQEATNNAIKHAKAKNIDIDIVSSDERLVLAIKDDGVGFTPGPKMKKGMGLNIIKCRAEMIGASLSIAKCPEGGTIVKCSVRL